MLTGETGAGKSILLDALGLALGARADSALVRAGQPQASVSAGFDVARRSPRPRPARATTSSTPSPASRILVRRIVRADGGSRAFVNDQPVSAGLLRALGETLVEIHGQHDERGLLNPRGHRALLDAYGRIDLAPGRRRLARAERSRRSARLPPAPRRKAPPADRDWLAHAVEELRRLAPEPGEEERLAGLRATMQAGARIGDELAAVESLVLGSEGALAQLRQAARRLDRMAAEHATLAEALAALDRAVIEAAEGEDALARARAALAFDPARLDEAETRLFDIRALARKHRVEPDALPALADELAAPPGRDRGRRRAHRHAGSGAGRSPPAPMKTPPSPPSAARREAAARLDAAVAAELAPLKLEAAQFRTAFAPAEPSAAGIDRVEFEVSTNPGAPFGPLTSIASGGELSRFVLALKVALHEEGGPRTIIFDEIDRGVGGAVASAVGERLHRLAAAGQVLVVTHSPQVAARGARHLLIEKSHDGLVTRTGVSALDPARRREEIARMLSGAQVTDEARAQAERLLEAA